MKAILYEQIKQVFEFINDQREDPVALLEAANRLSTINYNIGDLYVGAKILADNLEADYKNKMNDSILAYREDKRSVEESKSMAAIDQQELYREYLAAEHEAMEFRIKRDDINSKISVIQSYCSELRNRRNFEASANK